MSKTSRALALQIGSFVILGALFCALGRHFHAVRLIEHIQRRIGAMEEWGLILYPLLYATCNILLLPAGVLGIGAGFFFGLWWGFGIVLFGNVLAAAVAFTISRRLGRRWFEKKMRAHPKWVLLDEAIAREGWKIIFLSQVHPLFPTSLLNYLYGVTRIRFWPCMLWVALGQTPGLFLYAYLGTLAQLGLKLVRGKTHPFLGEYALWLGGLGLSLGVMILLGHLAVRILRDIEEAEPTAVPPQMENDSPAPL